MGIRGISWVSEVLEAYILGIRGIYHRYPMYHRHTCIMRDISLVSVLVERYKRYQISCIRSTQGIQGSLESR